MVQQVDGPPNPKANGDKGEPEFLPSFPAAYSLPFADWAIEMLNQKVSTLIDPFSGSGTTLLAAQNKVRDIAGFELNPIWSIYTRARLVSWEEGLEDALIAEFEPILNPGQGRPIEAAGEILRKSLDPGASPQKTLAAAALLIIARERQNPEFGINHSWPQLNGSGDFQSFDEKAVRAAASRAISHAKWVREEFGSVGIPYVANADIRSVCPLPAGQQLILTSPPYLSRLDYIKASEPEFRLLRQFGIGEEFSQLRGAQIGSVKVADLEVPESLDLPAICESTINMIKKHPSKGSESYYWKFVQKYLLGMRDAFRTLSESALLGSHLVFVVQDSWYKEQLLPTTAMLVSLLEELGWSTEDKWVFVSGQQLSNFNPHARNWRQSNSTPERVVHMKRTSNVR